MGDSTGFAVTIAYSFDAEVRTYLFTTFAKARQFMEDSFQNELRVDQDENGLRPEHEISFCDDISGCATITNRRPRGDDVTYWWLGEIRRDAHASS